MSSKITGILGLIGALFGITATVVSTLAFTTQQVNVGKIITGTASQVGIDDPAPLCTLSVG